MTVFVDTSAWFAAMVPWDAEYAAAQRWLSTNTVPFTTTDYVVDETLTLLKARGELTRALAFGEAVFAGRMGAVCHVEEADVLAAWQIFRDFSDKGWSFTDCVSRVVMLRLRIERAFCFDQHFRQFGTVEVVPS